VDLQHSVWWFATVRWHGAGLGDWYVGAGKTTVLVELRRRGHLTVDTDYDGWVRPDGRWDERRMGELLTISLR